MNARIIWAIARKDIVDAVRNLYVLFGISFPLGIWLLFRIILPGDTDLKVGPIGVYDEGSSRLVELLSEDPLVKNVVVTRSEEELTQVIRKDAVGGLVLPADFDRSMYGNLTPDLVLMFNGSRGGGELAALRRIVDDNVRELSGRPLLVRLVERDVNETSGQTPARPFSVQGYLLVVLLVTGLTMTGVFVVPTLLVEEKEKRTLKAILVSPASYADVIAGKAMVGLFYALLMATLLLALNDGLSGNVPLLALGIILGSVCLVGVGLLMGALFNTSGQVNTWSSVVMLLLLAPTWTTGIGVSPAVETGLRLTPTYYVSALIRVARGDPAAGDALTSVVILLACIVGLFFSIVWALRRSEA